MKVTIRKARQEDQPTIRRMIRQAGINPLSLNWQRFLIAEESGSTVGIVQLKPHRDGSLELASLAVLPDRQRQGIGGALINALLAETAPPVYLTCRRQLATYYERFGFTWIPASDMPPYFRLVNWLANLATFGKPRLAIMRWNG